ncbi:MAG: MBL fold metallo-hydrolase [Myxococcota bacterium]|nr:MBL fold metallo-hydrolase [Myxococcota bacterium]
MTARSLLALLLIGCPDIAPIEDGKSYGSIVTIKDSFTSCYLLKAGAQVILFDSCWRHSALKAGLDQHGLTPAQVTHVFMTHGHGDHVGGLSLMPQAKVHALRPEQPNLTDNGRWHAAIDEVLRDGQELRFGAHTIRVLAVPGHTPGTAVYWVDGVVILGDSARVNTKGQIVSEEGFSEKPEQAADSLASLASRLQREQLRVDWLVPAHTGSARGVQPLVDFAASHSR